MIWDMIEEMITLVTMSEVRIRAESEVREEVQQHRNGPIDDMFEELKHLAMEDQAVVSHEHELHNTNKNEGILNRVDAELLFTNRNIIYYLKWRMDVSTMHWTGGA
jgi:adenylate cyclase class IV